MTTTRPVTTSLSKSRYIQGLQCPKALWLTTYRPDLKDEVSAAQEAVFQSGTDVGVLAQELFPGGVEIPYDGLTPAQQLERTRQLLADGATTLYEAAFSHDGVFVKVDLLHQGRAGWELHEVKGSTGLKEVYRHDIAVQHYVVTGTGLPLAYSGLVHINNNYVRQGSVEVAKLFTKLDLTAEVVGRQPEVRGRVATLRAVLAGDQPDVAIGPHCSDPYECPFAGHCWAAVPSPSVFDLAGYGKPDPFALYREGLVRFDELPLERLGWRQRQQVETYLGNARQVDPAAVTQFLDTLTYPLAFLDFETTCLTPVPLFDGTWPYQAVPFQYSLHVLREPGAALEHSAWLADWDDNHPQAGFGASLLRNLPQTGTILAWHMGFEKARLKELADHYPDYAPAIAGILDRFIDLIVPFRSRAVYDWQMMGSASLKSVLPALIPELSYADLEIGDGGAAAAAWLELRETADAARRETLRHHLLTYCHLDTLAMVRIVDWLREQVRE